MKRLLVSLVFVFAYSGNLHAEQGVRESLEKMFELTDMDGMLDSSYAHMDQIFSQMNQENDIPEDKKAIFEKHRENFRAMLVETMSWEKVKEPIIQAYSRVYTKEEVDELNVFYQSPLGQKMIKKMPELMQVTMQVMQEHTKALLPKIQAMNKELQDELNKQS